MIIIFVQFNLVINLQSLVIGLNRQKVGKSNNKLLVIKFLYNSDCLNVDNVSESIKTSFSYILDQSSQSCILNKANEKLEDKFRGILVDVDDPPTVSNEETNLEPPPTLINGVLYLLQKMLKPLLHVFSQVLGFGIGKANNIVIGK